jgi:hypothetical protein
LSYMVAMPWFFARYSYLIALYVIVKMC